MVHIEREIKNGITYIRVSHRVRINGKSRRVWSIWLGREDKIKENIQDIKNITEGDFEPIVYDYGLPVVLMKQAERLDLINIVNECSVKRDQGLSVGHYIMIAILQRCIKPRSKRHIRNWFYSTYLQYMFPKITTYLDSMAYTNHYIYLTREIIEEIETRIVEKLREEFQVEMKELFFDPTNLFTYTSPKRENQKLLGYGHSKEGRHDLNLVNFSLICTRDGGLPVMHCTYSGGTHDASHFKEQYPKILSRLKKLKISAHAVILVFDKGNISPEVFKALDESGIHWNCSIRPSVHKDLNHLASDDFPRYKLPNEKEVGLLEFRRPMFSEAALKASKVPDYKNPERRLIVQYNPRRAKLNRENLMQNLQARMDQINRFFKGPEKRLENGKKFPKWRKKTAVEAKIKQLITDNNKQEYLEYITYRVKKITGPTEKDNARIQYELILNEKAIQEKGKTLGKSYFMTNHPSMASLEIVWTYRQQFNVERAFRYLKDPESIRIRPIRVFTDDSIRGHIFTCVLGLLLLSLTYRELSKTYPELSLDKIREILSEIKVVQVEFPNSRKVARKLVKLSPEAKKLADFYHLQDSLI
jgi:transposase